MSRSTVVSPLRPVVLGLVLAVVFLSVPSLYAQVPSDSAEGRTDGPRSVTVIGSVFDASNDEPLPGATVALRRASDGVLVTGSVAQPNGHFTVEDVPADTYDLEIRFVGYTPVERTDVLGGTALETVDLGPICLVSAPATAEGIEVTAARELMEVQIDRTVYNVREQVTAIGGSASDVLQDLPSIEVDIDGTISYRGNDNVAIHVNGRPSSLSGDALGSFLKSLSAKSVERVEVIPNPSARSQPDGMAGILNIVLSKNRSGGWSGGLTGGVGTSDAYNAAANMGYQNGPLQFFTTYGYRHRTRDISGTRLREDLLQTPSVTLSQTTADAHRRQSHAWTTQTEYQMAPSTSLGLETVLSWRDGEEDGRSTYIEHSAGGATEPFARLVDGRGIDLGIDTRLTVDHAFSDADHTVTAEIRYERDVEEEDGMYVERVLLAEGTLGDPLRRDEERIDEREQEGSARIDYARPMGALALETGYEGSLRRLSSDQAYERTELIGSSIEGDANAFGFDEQIHAAYGTLSADLGRVGLQAGLRSEQVWTTFSLTSAGDSYDNDYFSLYPSAFLTYEFGEGQQMRLSYSKRVNRPRLWQLNPVDDNEDRTFRRIGNPFLEPEYVHAFEVSYLQHWRALTLTTSPYFRHTVNEIQWRERYGMDGVTTQTFENFASSNSYGAEVIAALSPAPWMRGNVSVNGYRIVTDASNVDASLSNDALAYSGRASLTVTPRDGLDVQFSQYYRSPVNIAGGRMGSRSMTTVGLKQELFGGRASLGLQGRDVLGTMGFNLTRRDASFYQETTRDWGARRVSMSFSYRFGKAASDRRTRDRRPVDEGFDEGVMQ